MRFPNWFKIVWWAALLALLSFILSLRFTAIRTGQAAPVDVFIFLVWVAMLLVPLFQEVSFFGISLKQQVRELVDQVSSLRSEFHNTVDIRNQISPIFQIPAPPPDSKLPEIEERLRTILEEVRRSQGVRQDQVSTDKFEVPQNVGILFEARYEIERELRRIWRQRTDQGETRRALPVFQIARSLANEGVLDPGLANVVREVYSVASPAIHGESVSNAQVAFVKDVAPKLVATLKAIE